MLDITIQSQITTCSSNWCQYKYCKNFNDTENVYKGDNAVRQHIVPWKIESVNINQRVQTGTCTLQMYDVL